MIATPLSRALPWLFVLIAASAQAQPAPSMEERLRNQLRITTTQLQQAQNELAALKAGQPQAGAGNGDAAALKKELSTVRAELVAERGAREKLADAARQAQSQGQGVAEKAAAQIAQYRGAYDELLRMARNIEGERQRLTVEVTARKAALQRCEIGNAKLYSVGQDILRAYESVDMATVLAARQPFAAQSRVRYEQIAQEYGDKLYEGRFDAQAVPETPAQPAAASAAAPAQPVQAQ